MARLAEGAPSVDVIGYSAGGVVARLWATELGRRPQGPPDRAAGVAEPRHARWPASGPSSEAGRARRPASSWLRTAICSRSLNAGDATPSGPQWVTMWTDQDQVVTPPDSARLDGAVEVVAQDVCPGAQIDHGQLPTAPLMQGLVLRALAVPLMTEPTLG